MAGFRRQDTVEHLSGKDIFVGPNGVGKSSRIHALAIAMLGYCPGNSGKRPQDTFRMATSAGMTVGVETDSFRFSRSFTSKVSKKPNGSRDVSVTQEIVVSPSQGEKTIADSESRIASELGDFPMMLDFGQFLAKSDAERRKFFYTLAGVDRDAWTKVDVEKALCDRFLTVVLQKNDTELFRTYEEMIVSALEEWREGLDAESGVAAMLDWAESQQKHWNAKKRQAQGAVQQLAELKNQLEETDRHLAQDKVELERLQSELIGISSDIARQDEAHKMVDHRSKRMSELNTRLQELIAQTAPDIALVKAQISDLESKIGEVNVSTEVDGIENEITTLEQALAELDGSMQNHQRGAANAQASVEGLQTAVHKASERGGVCVISPTIGCPKDFMPFVDWATEELAKYRDAEREALAQVSKTDNQRGNIRADIKRLRERQQRLLKSTGETEQVNKSIRLQIRVLERQVEQQQASEKLRLERIEDAQAELARIQAEPIEPIAPTDLLKMHKQGLVATIADLKAKIEEKEKARTTISNMKASMIDSTEAENFHVASKYIAEKLGPKGIQGDMLINALNPIRDAVTANLAAMEIENEFFFRTESNKGQEVFRFGWLDEEDREVDFDSLSTGQQMLVLIALLTTMIERANPPCKVLAIDDLEHLWGDNLTRVLTGLNKIADRLDNIILAAAADIGDVNGWTVHRLGGDESVVMVS